MLNGGYVDNTGSPESNYQFSNIYIYIYILIRLKDRADMPAVFRIKFKALFSEVSQFLLQKRQELPDMPPVHKGMVDKDREGDRDPVFFAYSAVDQA